MTVAAVALRRDFPCLAAELIPYDLARLELLLERDGVFVERVFVAHGKKNVNGRVFGVENSPLRRG